MCGADAETLFALAQDCFLAYREWMARLGACVLEMCIRDREYIKKHGYRVPEDYSVTGLDNLEISSYEGVNLTTVTQPSYEIGMAAADILIDKIRGHDLSTDAYRILESSFVIRKSCMRLSDQPSF